MNTEHPDIYEVLHLIEDFFEVEEYSFDLGYNVVRGKVKEPAKENIQKMIKILKEKSIAIFLSRDEKGDIIRFAFIPPKKVKRRVWLHLLLFFATVLTTLLAGSFYVGGNPFSNFKDIFLGVPFSFSLLLILGSHELGHYFTCKKYGVEASLPYFIPAPFFPVGTFGAVIKMSGIVPNKKALIRVGIAGPLVGFLIAIPITLIGLFYSETVSISKIEGGLGLGSSIIFTLLTWIAKGGLPEGKDILLHPAAFAGWFGFFVTALNLIPLGQLDGGHIAYAVLGKYRKYITIATLILLFTMGIMWFGWIIWALFIVILGLRHPPVSDEITLPDRADICLGILALLIFILTFVPAPFIWIK